jgi:hypothetical protein
MIDFERKEPEKIRLLKMLLDWLPDQHHKRQMIESELVNRIKGYKGERDVDFYLRQLPNKKFHILNGLRLIIDEEVFQMDTLILSPKFFLIIEIKNYSRKIIYDTIHDQFIHERLDGTQERAQNPISQAERQSICLSKLLFKHGFTSSPIEIFVANSNPSTILETVPANPLPMPPIYNSDNLVRQIGQLDSKYSKDIWSETNIKSLIKLLKKLHTPPTYNLLNEYRIGYDELPKGIPCPECHFCPMVRRYGCWICPSCGFQSRDAHVPKINNFLDLVQPHITNQECCVLCKVDSEDTSKRLLGKMELNSIGNTRTRRYFKK